LGHAALAEANRSGLRAVAKGHKHGRRAARSHETSSPVVLRMPPQYAPHDVELLLEALWAMFTESQARKLVVSVPWGSGDEQEEPQRMVLADLAALLESWLG
jgi:hypothetical protein